MDINQLLQKLAAKDPRAIARAITLVENSSEHAGTILSSLDKNLVANALILGITGPPGAGKSTLTNSLIKHLRSLGHRIGIIAVDPSSPISGGAILGDRVRMMKHALDPDVIVRSMATRGRLGGLCASAGAAVRIMASAGCEFIIIETVGVGQSEMDIVQLADITLMVLAPGFGDDIQAMKAGILEVADLMVVNKADQAGSDALVMDMEQLFRDRHLDPAERVLETIATENKGIDTLLDAINSYSNLISTNGIKDNRRNNSIQLETLDWTLEMLRPKILEIIQQQATDTTDKVKNDPRITAVQVIDTLTQKTSNTDKNNHIKKP